MSNTTKRVANIIAGRPVEEGIASAHTRQKPQPGDWFGECPKCGEQWELKHAAGTAPHRDAPDLWECDHCGNRLNLTAMHGLLAAAEATIKYLDATPPAEWLSTAGENWREMRRVATCAIIGATGQI